MLLTLIRIKWVPGDPSTTFLPTIFTQKNRESSGSIYSSILMLENDIIILPEMDRIYKKLWIFSNLIRVPGDPQLKQTSVSWEFGPL